MQNVRLDLTLLLVSLQSVSPRPASGPLPVCLCPLIPSLTPAITSCTHARLTSCHPAAWRDREIGTATATRRAWGGAHAVKKEETARKTRWIEKLHCCCISGRFWVGLWVCSVLSVYVGLRFIAFPFTPCDFHNLHQSRRTVGAARRCRRPEDSTSPA